MTKRVVAWMIRKLRPALSDRADRLMIVGESCAEEGIGTRQFFAVLRKVERRLDE